MGGLPMTAAANQAPQTLDRLIYLSAFVPVTGERFMNLARGDEASLLASAVRPNPFFGAIRLDKGVWHDALFHDCSGEDEKFCEPRISSNPIRPALRKLELSEHLASVPKSYILCSNDRAITPKYQRWMANRSEIPIEHELPSGHMPMFGMPTELAQVLVDCISNT